MDVRELLTGVELEEIKRRVVREILDGHFFDTVVVRDGEDTVLRKHLKAAITNQVKAVVLEMLHDEVERIAREVVQPRIAEMAELMTSRFVKQTREIVDKINWYWSIK